MRWPIVIVVAAITGSPAAASPGDAPWDGAVFAGPTSPHPANIIANPAPMLLATPGIHVFIGGVGTFDQLSIDRQLVDENGAFTDGPSIDGTTAGAGGNAGIMRAWPGGSIAFIASVPPPDETLAGEAALGYHTRGSRTRRVDYGTLSAAYRLTSRISLGLAGTFSTRDTVLRFARDTALEAGRDPSRGIESDCGGMRCGLEHPLATELWTVTVASDRWNVFGVELPALTLDDLRFSAGGLVILPGDVLVGITYQRPWNLGRVERTGDTRVVSAPRDGGAVRVGEATLFVRQPQLVRLGARSRMRERWDLVGELRWRLLGRASYEDVRTYGGDLAAGGIPPIYARPRGLRDAIALELGVEEIDDGQVLRLGGRVGIDSGAVASDRLSARAPWGAQLTAGGGAQLRLGSRWVVQLTYNTGYQPSASSNPGAFDPVRLLDCIDSGYDVSLPACATVRAGYGAPTSAGTYARWSHVGRVSLALEIP